MDINQNLHGVLGNLVRNRKSVDNNMVQVQTALSQLDDESLASINQLLKKFEHPQSVTQFINAVAQAEGLKQAAREMDTAIAILQVAADDDAFQIQAQAQMLANESAAKSPLPTAGQSSASAPADQGAQAVQPAA